MKKNKKMKPQKKMKFHFQIASKERPCPICGARSKCFINLHRTAWVCRTKNQLMKIERY